MPLPWSAPAYEQGVTPAIASSRYEVSAPNIGHVLAAILSDRERQQGQNHQEISEAVKAVSGFMDRQRQDKIAQAMLDQASDYDNENPSLTEAMARALNEGDLHPADAWAAFTQGKAAQFKDAAASIQEQKLDLMREKLNQSGLVDVTLPTGQTVKVPAAEAFRYYYEPGSNPKHSAIEKAAAPYGLTGEDVGMLDFNTPDAIKFRDSAGNPISTADAEQSPSTSVATGQIGDKTFSMPYGKFRQVRSLALGSTAQRASSTAQSPAQAGSGTPPQSAIDYLKEHPELSDQFDAKYGAGAAARYLQ